MITRLFKILVLVIFVSFADFAMAQDGKKCKFEGNFSIGLNSDGYDVFVGAHWMPIPYAGIGGAVGFLSEIEDYSHEWAKYDNNYRFAFKPSLMFYSPKLFAIRSGMTDFRIFASPGLMMATPAQGAKNSAWLYWNGEAGLTVTTNARYSVALGYGYSNFNLWDGVPLSDRANTHFVFLRGSVKF